MGILDSLKKGYTAGQLDARKAQLERQQNRESAYNLAEPNRVTRAVGRAVGFMAPAKEKAAGVARAADHAIDKIQGGESVFQSTPRKRAPKHQGNPTVVVIRGDKVTKPRQEREHRGGSDMSRFMPSGGSGMGSAAGDSGRFAMPKRKW